MRKEVKILEYKTVYTIENPEENKIIIGKDWFVDGIRIEKSLKELLEKYLSEGWKIEFASETYYVLSRQVKDEK
jgi:hypothetical protein